MHIDLLIIPDQIKDSLQTNLQINLLRQNLQLFSPFLIRIQAPWLKSVQDKSSYSYLIVPHCFGPPSHQRWVFWMFFNNLLCLNLPPWLHLFTISHSFSNCPNHCFLSGSPVKGIKALTWTAWGNSELWAEKCGSFAWEGFILSEGLRLYVS